MKTENKVYNSIAKTIFQRHCVVFIGPEFPVIFNGKMATFNEITCGLLEDLISEKIENGNYGIEVKNDILFNVALKQRNSYGLANFYIQLQKGQEDESRSELEFEIERFFMNKEIEIPLFEKLSSLPISHYINLTFLDTFCEILEKKYFDQVKNGFYHFRSTKHISYLSNFSDNDILIYNLLGKFDRRDARSLVLSELEMIELVTNVISDNKGLPTNVKDFLINKDNLFLFLGCRLISESWYFKIILHYFKKHHNSKYSKALKETTPSQNSEYFIKYYSENFTTEFIDKGIEEFIQNLVDKYEEEYINFLSKSKVFISYSRSDERDEKAAFTINEILTNKNYEVFFDREDAKGLYEEVIKSNIEKSNYFIILQSQSLKARYADSFVLKEVKWALEYGLSKGALGDFLIPLTLDQESSLLGELRDAKLHNLHLAAYDNFNTSDKTYSANTFDELIKYLRRLKR